MIDKNFGVVFVTVKAHFSDVSRDRRSRQPDCMRYFVARGTLDVMTFFFFFQRLCISFRLTLFSDP